MSNSLYAQAKRHVINSRNCCDRMVGYLGAVELDYAETEKEISDACAAMTTAVMTMKECHSHLLLLLTGMVEHPDQWRSPDYGDTGSNGFDSIGSGNGDSPDSDAGTESPGGQADPD